MRTRHLLLSLAGLGLGLVVTGACTNGAGGVPSASKNPGNSTNQSPSSGSLPTGGSDESPGSGYEPAGSGGYEPTGGQEPTGGGTDPSGAAGCLLCTTYTCSFSYSGSNGSTGTVLQLTALPGGAGCTTGSGGSELLCDGTVDAPLGDGGALGVVGSWTRAGEGFVVTASVGISGVVGSGVVVSIACEPGGASSSAGNGGGSSASSSSGGTPITFDAGGVVITFDAG